MKNYLNLNFDLNKMIDVYDELPLWSAPFGLKLLECIDYRPGITALDLGFGTGFPLTEIAMRLGESSVVYGIDPWKESFERVRKKIECYQISNIRLIEGVAEKIPLEDGSVDIVTSNNCLNNVEDMEQAFRECARVLKPGGQFIHTMNTDKSMFEFYEAFEQVLAENSLFREIDLMRSHIAKKRPSTDKMIRLAADSGFVIKDLHHSQFNYKFANVGAMFSHYFIRLAFMDSWLKLVPPGMADTIFGQVEDRLHDQSLVTGGIRLSIPFILINAIRK